MSVVQEMIRAIETARSEKDLGTEALQAGNTVGAKARYQAALDLLKDAHVDQLPSADMGEELRSLFLEMRRKGLELDLACNLNLALCCIKLECWTEAMDAAGRAVSRDPSSAKAWFRRGLARAGAGQDEEARSDLHKAATLAPNDAGIRAELSAVKERLSRATECVAGTQEKASSSAMAAAMVGGGRLYDCAEAGLARINNLLLLSERTIEGGRATTAAEAIATLRGVFKMLMEEERKADEICYRQRFKLHLLSGRCHIACAKEAQQADAKGSALSRAVADLQRAVSLVAEAKEKGRGVGSEPEDLAVAAQVDVASANALLGEATALALQHPAKEPSFEAQ